MHAAYFGGMIRRYLHAYACQHVHARVYTHASASSLGVENKIVDAVYFCAEQAGAEDHQDGILGAHTEEYQVDGERVCDAEDDHAAQESCDISVPAETRGQSTQGAVPPQQRRRARAWAARLAAG
jgi:hypothetical protein